ncbi:MAG TPA: phospholipid carrier-dependent glycosyltransferase, partial [Blastocatellia bacterium]|nr:phospholipid carrier-dependent glycosyltransferase [Blastocatellia bacterium]
LVFLIAGASRLTGIAVNLLSLAALLWGTASIARLIYAESGANTKRNGAAPSPWLSALPALIAACYHFNAWLMHDAFLDFPLVAAVTVSFAFLIRAGDFADRRKTLAFGIAAGVGMLVKQTFAFFFVLPALYVLIRVLWKRDRQAIVNLALAAAVLVLIAALWYVPHLRDVIAIYRENQQAAVNENEAPLFNFDSNFFYVHALLSMQMQLPFALLFVGGLVYSLVRCRKQSVLIYLWLVSGLVSFALVANKDVRYTVPVLPAAAVLSVCWLRAFPPTVERVTAAKRKAVSALKLALVAAITVWCFVSFFNAQWPRPGFGKAIDTPRYRWMVFARNYYGFDHRPLEDDWSVPEIVRTLVDLNRGRNDESTSANSSALPVLGVVVNLPYLNPSSVALYSRLLTDQRAGPPLIDVRWVIEPPMIERLQECDYVLVRTGLDEADWVAKVERDVEQLIQRDPRFTPVASFPVPLKNAEAILYRFEKSQR